MLKTLFQPGHLLLTIGVALVVFAPKLPEVGTAVGEGIRSIKDAMKEADSTISKK